MNLNENYNYGIIGNCTSAALVSADCSIDWLCLPFFDSPSLFGKILDAQKGGYFKISARNVIKTQQSYVFHTAIIKTIFETQEGVFEVRDYMPRFKIGAGESYCPSEVHRDIHVISGKPQIIIELKPRPNYAISDPNFSFHSEYIKIATANGPYASYYLYTNLDHKKVVSGEPIELTESSFFLLSHHEKLEPINLYKIYVEYEKTKSYWLDWAYHTQLPEKHREMLIRSAITLKMLVYERTGAVIAAPTTSLPEIIGKDRNWDYRFCWMRDASMIIDMYARIGHVGLAERYINFVLNRMLLKHDNIGVMYGINGETVLTEKVLDHLEGYKGSKPVRIGNAAYSQKQNDFFGELIEMVYTYFIVGYRQSQYLNEEIWTVVRTLVNYVEANWQQPDSGIWERRGDLRHYVHSKMMSWVAMDRAAKIATFIGRTEYAKRCESVAAAIKEDILKHGWNEKLKAFTMAYGSEEMDAATLLMLRYNFLDRKDPRIISTVDYMYKKLVKNNFVFRYVERDEFGLPENAFIVCIFWMINALYLVGREAEARAMFDNILSCANPLGLFAEDVEIVSRRLTGNFPQGYSHLAFIQTVFFLETDYNWSSAFKPQRHMR